VSCLAEQAKILVAEAEENNLGDKAMNESWDRWHMCSLCEQGYHGVVKCALSWACWKTYLGRPETCVYRSCAMTTLGNGLFHAHHHEDALTVQEAELSMLRRVGASENDMLIARGNLASTYQLLGRLEEALPLRRDVYSGWLKLNGEGHRQTVRESNNYATTLSMLRRFKETKSLLRKTMPVARRVLGETSDITLKMRKIYAQSLCQDDSATLDELREAVTTLEETERTARRVLGGDHPLTVGVETSLRNARAALAARAGDDVSSVREALRKAKV
jgi:hypothetical protein